MSGARTASDWSPSSFPWSGASLVLSADSSLVLFGGGEDGGGKSGEGERGGGPSISEISF